MAAGKGHPAKEKAAKQKTIHEKNTTKQKTIRDKQKTIHEKKNQPDKQKTTAGDENSPKKQPTKKKTIREEKKVKLFEDKQEKAWADGSPVAGKIELATVAEEDPNVFHGEPIQGEASPMIPRAKEEERRKAEEGVLKIANGL
jgi:hypothetical protein